MTRNETQSGNKDRAAFDGRAIGFSRIKSLSPEGILLTEQVRGDFTCRNGEVIKLVAIAGLAGHILLVPGIVSTLLEALLKQAPAAQVVETLSFNEELNGTKEQNSEE